ncbi:MAG: tetratricopeptide repeat protein [Pseudomonadota bacterium]
MSTGWPSLYARLRSALRRREVWGFALLALTVIAAYAPSLGGGFLDWDDPWLISENPIFRSPSARHLALIWTDLSESARLSLGAEYLPLRDTTVWLEAICDGLSPQAMRWVSLGCYLGALGFLRGALLRALGASLGVELALFVFALHPVHVESVAWLAGRKDVLALLFVSAALFVHAGQSKLRPFWVPLLLLCAHFSKAQSVIAVGLLVAHDLLAKRRLDARVYGPALLSAALAALVHMHVGRLVNMTTSPAGRTPWSALLTMGEVTTRYLRISVWPAWLSIVYDVPTRTRVTLGSLLGYGVLLAWLGIALFAWRRWRAPLALSAWLWFVVPLLPVSQVLFPLQNRMADRYLLFSVMSVALLAGLAFDRWPLSAHRVRALAAFTLVGVLGVATVGRSALFASSAPLFADATRKTVESATAPYVWGGALEAQGDVAGAQRAYEEALRRPGATEAARRATNNLARSYARQGRDAEASALLVRGRRLWPNDPKILYNLAKLAARRHDDAETARLLAELHRRFPAYRPGQRSPEDFYQAY